MKESEYKKYIIPSEFAALYDEWKAKGRPSPMKGKHLSEEQKRHLSEINRCHKVSEETKKKLSDLYKDKHWKLVGGKRVWY